MRRPFASTPFGSRRAEQSSQRSPRPSSPTPRLITRLCGATAARLRLQKGRDIPDLVSDRRSVDSPERAADVQSSFVLQHLHAATADGGVHVLVDPRPWDRWHLLQIDRLGNAAHIVTALPVSGWQIPLKARAKALSPLYAAKMFHADVPGVMFQPRL